MYLLIFQAGTAIGSLLWGAVAERIGLQRSLICAGVGLLLNLALVFHFSLNGVAAINVAQGSHWPEPPALGHANSLSSPTLVTVHYEVDPSRGPELACLSIATAAVRAGSNSATSSNAASVSLTLL